MAAGDDCAYPGQELGLFAAANNWKRYIKAKIKNYLKGKVLEVGAGIGNATLELYDGVATDWICLEPDATQAERLRRAVFLKWGISAPAVIAGSLRAIAEQPRFDCLLYLDVLEHIEDDQGQIAAAARLLRPGGHMVLVCPAHQWLFSEFDRSIGHLRRYNKPTLRSLMPSGWIEKELAYLDSIGVILSLGNVLALRRRLPSRAQLYFWDRACVPLSRIVDSLLRGSLGKSILAVWQKPEDAAGCDPRAI